MYVMLLRVDTIDVVASIMAPYGATIFIHAYLVLYDECLLFTQ